MRTPDEIQAAITRGTLAAFGQFNSLEAEAVSELVAMYQQTAEELADLIRRSANSLGRIDLAVLQVLLAQIRQRLEALSEQIAPALRRGIIGASAAGPAALAGIAPEAAIVSSATDAAEFVMNLHRAGGLGLSERIWNLDRGAFEVVSRAVQSALVIGEGPHEAAWELVARNAQEALLTTPGNPLFKAARVMRTEMARAYNAAYVNSSLAVPGLIGFKFNLSPLHTVADLCDSLAKTDKFGLGPGVFPVGQQPEMPVHPHGRSYLTAVVA